jgi:hypothetical protein
MNRRLKKLIEEKAWETLTDYGYDDSQLLEQLTESVLERLGNQGYLKEQKQNLQELSRLPLPKPPGTPGGGMWDIDPITGELLYVVTTGTGTYVYRLDGSLFAGPFGSALGPDSYRGWYFNRRKMANKKTRKPGGTPDDPYYDKLSPTKSKPGFTPGGMGPNTGGPGPIDGGIFGN